MGIRLSPQRLLEVLLKGVVEADGTCVLETIAKKHAVNARPIDCAHTHRARCAVDLDVAALEHAGAHGNWIRRARLASKHFQHCAGTVLGAEKALGI
jgi:hypothetical protein